VSPRQGGRYRFPGRDQHLLRIPRARFIASAVSDSTAPTGSVITAAAVQLGGLAAAAVCVPETDVGPRVPGAGLDVGGGQELAGLEDEILEHSQAEGIAVGGMLRSR